MKTYNGHRSYNAWNIALWIHNDEGLYYFSLECLRTPTQNGSPPSIGQAVRRFMGAFEGEKTPDGVPYTALNVKEALRGLVE